MIKEITTAQTYLVRQPVLRPRKSIEFCYFDGDDLPTTKHYGFFIKKKLVGVITLKFIKNNNFICEQQYQIRGMAVLENYQKKGVGARLLQYAENIIQQNGGHLIWFNARITAINFYKTHNYITVGKPFEIVDIGAHYLMHKII